MSSPIIIAPQLYKGEALEVQQSADMQIFMQRRLQYEVFRWEIPSLSGTGAVSFFRMCTRPSTIIKVRTYSGVAGSGSFTIDALWRSNGGVDYSVFAVAGDRVTASSILMVEKDATANRDVDPADPAKEGRCWVNIVGFSGTAWTNVVIEILLIPRSYS